MRRFAVLLILVAVVSTTTGQTHQQVPRDYPVRAVPMRDVDIDDECWRPRMETNRTVTIAHIIRQTS